jgi:D-lactate dehydrogenase (cytochrome)
MSETIGTVLQALAPRFKDRFSVAHAVREQHGRGESHHTAAVPDAVFFAESTEEVAEVVRLCAAARVPVIAFGAGTSLEGHLAAVRGGISIDLSRMAAVLRVSSEDLDCTVQAGATREQLNTHLRDTACFSQSIQAPTLQSAAWPPRVHRARTRFATARCAKTCCR